MDKPNTQASPIVDSKTCDHFFIFAEKKKLEYYSGTHETHCKFCGKNSHKQVCDLVVELHKKGIITSDMDERVEESLCHVHVWAPVGDNPHTYECLSEVTDWAKSTAHIKQNVICGQLITVNH